MLSWFRSRRCRGFFVKHLTNIVGKKKKMGGEKIILSVRREIGSGHVEPDYEIPSNRLRKSRRLKYCHPELRRRARAMMRDAKENHGRELVITCTYRSVERQQELYRRGRQGVHGERKVTWVDGINKISKHNLTPSRAVDFAVDEDPGLDVKITWKEKEYAFLGPLAKKHGLVWGGTWKKFRDRPHVELPEDIA